MSGVIQFLLGGRLPAGQPTPVSDADPLPVVLAAGSVDVGTVDLDQTTQGGTNGVDQTSVTITDRSVIGNATGASQTLVAASMATRSVLITNPRNATTNWTIRPDGGVSVANTVPGIVLYPGDVYSPAKPPKNAITGIGTANSSLVVETGA